MNDNLEIVFIMKLVSDEIISSNCIILMDTDILGCAAHSVTCVQIRFFLIIGCGSEPSVIQLQQN